MHPYLEDAPHDSAPQPEEILLADLARPVAAEGRRLLHASSAVLLSVTLLRGRTVPITVGWSGAIDPLSLRGMLDLGDAAVRQALAAFEHAGARLIAELARRWPANAVPPAIGVVTDGGGVVFSPDLPSPLMPDWLALQQGGGAAAATLLPFSEIGAWALLTAPVAQHRLH